MTSGSNDFPGSRHRFHTSPPADQPAAFRRPTSQQYAGTEQHAGTGQGDGHENGANSADAPPRESPYRQYMPPPEVSHDIPDDATTSPLEPVSTHYAATVSDVPYPSGKGAISRIASIVLTIIVLGAGASYFFANGSLSGTGNLRDDRSYSYYQDRHFDTSSFGTNWEVEDAFGDKNNVEYDGPYAYEKYGSAALKKREKTGDDPTLESSISEGEDVFSEYLMNTPSGAGYYGAAQGSPNDPTRGAPVGVDPVTLNTGYTGYSAYTGFYSNPYLNQIRLRFGEGSGLGQYNPGAAARP